MSERTDGVFDLTCELIRLPSVTPDDAGCQALISRLLSAQGFDVESLPFGEVSNLWAVFGEVTESPLFVFAGHTDVVPTGAVEAWSSDPFTPSVRNGLLYGRGAADMKGSIAAMITATRQFLAANDHFNGAIAYLITSDEEGVALNGTVKVVEHLLAAGIRPDYCIVGEPSSSRRLGDIVRIGRRGSLNAKLHVKGQQGHVAYPDLAVNPIHLLAPVLSNLTSKLWDNGNAHFPPTSFQVSNIHAGTGASNVIPGSLSMDFNLRYSTEQTSAGLQKQVQDILDDFALDYDIEWVLSGEPFLTSKGELIDVVTKSIAATQNIQTECSTGGGTSDGRFISRMGCELVELGPVNETIHQVDECVAIEDLTALSNLYQDILQRLLVPPDAASENA